MADRAEEPVKSIFLILDNFPLGGQVLFLSPFYIIDFQFVVILVRIWHCGGKSLIMALRTYSISVVDKDVFHLHLVGQYLSNLSQTAVQLFTEPTHVLDGYSMQPEVVFLALHAEDATGFACLRDIKKRFPDTYVVAMIRPSGIQLGVDAVGQGAFDYILQDHLEAISLRDVLAKIGQVKDLLETYYAKQAMHEVDNSIFPEKLA